MKAYQVYDIHGDYSTVIFAETANKAKVYAKDWSDVVEFADYIDLRAKRLPLCDSFYNGKSQEGDWHDMNLRKILVEEYGWYCIEPDHEECAICRLCDQWEGE